MINYTLKNCENCSSESLVRILQLYYCLQCNQYYKFEVGDNSHTDRGLYSKVYKIVATICAVIYLTAKYLGDDDTIMILVNYLSALVFVALFFYLSRFPKRSNFEKKPVSSSKEEYEVFLKKMMKQDYLYIFGYITSYFVFSYFCFHSKLQIYSYLLFPIILLLIYFPIKSLQEINKYQKTSLASTASF